jgi:hypothetical protein
MAKVKSIVPSIEIELFDMDEIKKQAQSLAVNRLRKHLEGYFDPPRFTHTGSRDRGGEGYELMKSAIESLALSDDFRTEVLRQVDVEFKEVLSSAVKRALEHLVSGQVFPRGSATGRRSRAQ